MIMIFVENEWERNYISLGILNNILLVFFKLQINFFFFSCIIIKHIYLYVNVFEDIGQ